LEKKKNIIFYCYPFFTPQEIKKRKGKIEKQNSRGMKKAQKIFQVGGERSK